MARVVLGLKEIMLLKAHSFQWFPSCPLRLIWSTSNHTASIPKSRLLWFWTPKPPWDKLISQRKVFSRLADFSDECLAWAVCQIINWIDVQGPQASNTVTTTSAERGYKKLRRWSKNCRAKRQNLPIFRVHSHVWPHFPEAPAGNRMSCSGSS